MHTVLLRLLHKLKQAKLPKVAKIVLFGLQLCSRSKGKSIAKTVMIHAITVSPLVLI